jgi:hypothetical protein
MTCSARSIVDLGSATVGEQHVLRLTEIARSVHGLWLARPSDHASAPSDGSWMGIASGYRPSTRT